MISENKRLIGVADGVGGWNSYEICSGKLSKFLCKRLSEMYGADNSRKLKDIFYEGIHEAVAVTEGGSTTMVLAKLEPEITAENTVKMPALNLGDSAIMVLHPNQDGSISKTLRSKEQVWAFNAPEQCGHRC